MSRGFYISPFSENSACMIEEKGRTDHPDIDFSIIFLFADDSELRMEFACFIRNEGNTEVTAGSEFLMACFRIFRNTDNLDTEFRECLFESRKILRFERAAWGVIFRVEIEKGFFGLRKEESEIHRNILEKGSEILYRLWSADQMIFIGFQSF